MGGLAKPIVDNDPDAVTVLQPVAPQVTTTQAAAAAPERAARRAVAASTALEKVLLSCATRPDFACKLREAKTYVDMTMAACTTQDAAQALLASMAACSAAGPQSACVISLFGSSRSESLSMSMTAQRIH